jgi:hypothetical protein
MLAPMWRKDKPRMSAEVRGWESVSDKITAWLGGVVRSGVVSFLLEEKVCSQNTEQWALRRESEHKNRIVLAARELLALGLAIWLGGCVSARKAEEEAAPIAEAERVSAPFRVGERLTYEAYYGLLRAGTVTLTVQDVVEVCARPTYHVVMTLRSTPTFSNLLDVDDRVESYIDTDDLVPWKFAKVQVEGDYEHDEMTILDQENHWGHYRSNGSGFTKDYEIPEKCQDTLSIFYFVRLLSYDVGQRFVVKVMADEKIWDLAFEVKAAARRTIYRGGSYDTYVVESDACFDAGTLRKGTGRLWITMDEMKRIVCVKTKLSFGYLTLAMVGAENIYENPWAQEGETLSPEPG